MVLDLPKVKTANEITTALSVITQAVTRGELGPSEGNALAALLGEHRKVLESVEFERRLSAVEKAIGGQKG